MYYIMATLTELGGHAGILAQYYCLPQYKTLRKLDTRELSGILREW
jgi:hypothetical protein